jgi:Zn-dependent peptidase ImmA (M78 family)
MSSIPHCSRQYIEGMTERVLRWFNPRLLQRPQATPITDLVARLAAKGRVAVRYEERLGSTSRGRRILGEFIFHPPTILIDSGSGDGPRFRFTVAHELGHLVLHGHLELDFDALDDANPNIRDVRPHFHFGRKRPVTDRDWLEWQANAFASAILVPRSTVVKAITGKQAELGINRRGAIYVDSQPQNRRDYDAVMADLQRVYQTSRTMLRIRLRNLGLLTDTRELSARHIARHIGSLFREDSGVDGLDALDH